MSDKKADLWMPLYIGDYLADTMHLGAEEHGAYMMLIMYYWRNGGAIPNDANRLQQIARVKPSRASKQIMSTVLQFFEEKDGMLYHKRIEVEIVEAMKNQVVRSEKAKNAANARWGNKQCSDDAQALRGECTSPSPISTNVDNYTTSAHAPDDEKPEWVRVGAKINEIVQSFGFMPMETSTFVSCWLSWEADPDTDIYPIIIRICESARKQGKTIHGLKYFNDAVAQAVADRKQPMPEVRKNEPSRNAPKQHRPSAHENFIAGAAMFVAERGES